MKNLLKSRLSLFLFKLTVILIVWLGLYHLVLKPTGQPDKFLRTSQAYLASSVLGERYDYLDKISKTTLIKEGEPVINIADSCDGLILFILFMAFILSYPGSIRSKAWFIPLGLLVIFVSNVLRIICLTLIHMNYPDFLSFSHHFVFTAIVYGIIFLLWMWYVNKLAKR